MITEEEALAIFIRHANVVNVKDNRPVYQVTEEGLKDALFEIYEASHEFVKAVTAPKRITFVKG